MLRLMFSLWCCTAVSVLSICPIDLTSPCGGSQAVSDADMTYSTTSRPLSGAAPTSASLPTLPTTYLISATLLTARTLRNATERPWGLGNRSAPSRSASRRFWRRVKRFDPSEISVQAARGQSEETIRDLTLNLMKYVVYIEHLVRDEEIWSARHSSCVSSTYGSVYQTSLGPWLRELLCVSQGAMSSPRAVSVPDIAYREPRSTTLADERAVLTLNGFIDDFLAFYLKFVS